MQFGLKLPVFGGKINTDQLLELAVKAEELGFDSVWTRDHVMVPKEVGGLSDSVRGSVHQDTLESLTTLTFIAARTKKVKLGTSVFILPQRNAVIVAKQLATLDRFSGGRVILGVGVGWSEKEFQYLGADFKRRGKILDEEIDLMRKIWTEDVVNFSGQFYHIEDGMSSPKPIQRPIPIWIGGNSEAAILRAMHRGDGWHPLFPTIEEFETAVASIKGCGREVTISMFAQFDVRQKREDYTGARGVKRKMISGSRGEILKSIDAYERAGLEYLVVYVNRAEFDEVVKDVDQFSRDIIGSYK